MRFMDRRDFLKYLSCGALATVLPRSALARGDSLGQVLVNPPEIRGINGVTSTELVVRYTDPHVVKVGPFPVRVRSFNGVFPGPTIRVRQGEQLKVRMTNRLPPNPVTHGQHDHNVPSHFNTTNLHTHGLHVSPNLGSDYVFLNIEPPGTKPSDDPNSRIGHFDYSFDIPADHSVGTHWFHPHRHGSTAIQVASGMAGALIVDPKDPKDEPDELRNSRDVIFLIHQVAFNLNNGIGEIEDFERLKHQNYPFVSINGQILPRIVAKQGEVLRLRMINAHFHSAIRLGLLRHRFHQISMDGIYLPFMRETDSVSLAPGNRSDVLLKAPTKPGIYPFVTQHYEPMDGYVYEGAKPGSPPGPCPRVPQGRFIAYLEVTNEKHDMPMPTALPAPTGLPDLSDRPVAKIRDFRFEFLNGKAVINGEMFAPDRMDQTFKIGDYEQWDMTADSGCHPFHIHVSPFKVWSVAGQELAEPEWRDTVMIPNKGVLSCRSMFTDFDGPFVIHCHRLKHEDLGMMQLVQTVF